MSKTNISADMEKRGFEECKSFFSFSRYVNERNDYGMREHLSESDYEYYLFKILKFGIT